LRLDCLRREGAPRQQRRQRGDDETRSFWLSIRRQAHKVTTSIWVIVHGEPAGFKLDPLISSSRIQARHLNQRRKNLLF
jgi:hypothetical protein